MRRVNRSTPHSPTGPWGLRPAVAGTACCIASALGYTAASICMRQLAAMECDPLWVTFNKESVTVLVVGTWLIYRAARRRPVRAPGLG